jgi:hypothetical protein
VIVLTNTDANSLYAALKWRILDAYLKQPVKDYSTVILEDQTKNNNQERKELLDARQKVAAKPAPALAWQNYVGKYEHPVYGEIEVQASNGGLRVLLSHHPNATGSLEAMGGNEFLCTFANPTFGIHPARFETAFLSSAVQSLTLKVNDFIEYDSYTFVKK